jgi:hypothetical protein
MASNPAIVRRAVANVRNPPIFGMFVLFDEKMVALNALLQMLGRVMGGIWRKHPFVRSPGDGSGVNAGAVGSQAIRGQQRLIRQHFLEEALRGGQIALGRQQKVNGRAVFINGPIEVAPLWPRILT